MSSYFLTYLVLAFFATSLAVADENMHGTEPRSSAAKRELAIDADQKESVFEVDNASGLTIIQALDNAEKSLGKKRAVGEVSEVETE